MADEHLFPTAVIEVNYSWPCADHLTEQGRFLCLSTVAVLYVRCSCSWLMTGVTSRCRASLHCCLQVISNAGLHNTYSNLLPPDVLANNPEMQEQLQQAAAAGGSPAIVNLYAGLNEPLVPEFEGVGTLRVFDSADHDATEAMLKDDGPPDLPPAVICCVDGREVIMPGAGAAAASSKGSLPRGQGVSTLQVITFASYDWFKRWGHTHWQRRGEEYEAFKQRYQEKLMKRLGEWRVDVGAYALSQWAFS